MSVKSFFSKCTIKHASKCIKIAALVGLVGGTSLVCTQLIMANDLGTVTKKSAKHDVTKLAYSGNGQIPIGYVKANYKITSSPGTEESTSDSKDLSREEAAEIIAQEIFKLSGESLNNHTMQMTYWTKGGIISQNDCNTKSTWLGQVYLTPSYGFNVNISASTGELLYIHRGGAPDIDESFDIDAPSTDKLISERLSGTQIKNNLDDACKKAKDFITQKGYIDQSIKSIKYVDTSCDAWAVLSNTFEVTTNSDKIYRFDLSEDLTQLISCYLAKNIFVE